jgi:hypothetical protein
MKGDFTRDTFDSRKHFTRVLMQQGRVQLDADWNEQAAILLRYMRSLAADLIGPHAGPADNLGFGLITDPKAIDKLEDAQGRLLDKETVKTLKSSLQQNSFLIGLGHYYVNGLLCENDDYLGFIDQPGELTKLNDLKNAKDLWLVYLDVWERHITALQDASIRETALGGPNTCTRAQVTWQVNLLRPKDQTSLQNSLNDAQDPAKLASAKTVIETLFEKERIAQTLPSDALLAARLQPSQQSEDPCIIDPDSVYRGAANQLYRVEIHTGGVAGTATFKWSRENGSIAAAWLGSEDNDLAVADARGFADEQWVELTDDLRELRGQLGTLVKLAKVEADTLTIDPASKSAPIDWNKDDLKPIVRGWDQRATDAITLKQGAVPVGEGTTDSAWIDLENGIQIRFLPGIAGAPQRQYRTGDYWLIPARVATGGIEWPVEYGADDKPKLDPATKKPIPLAQPPHGVEHGYAPLAITIFDSSNGKATVQLDLRRKIAALGI